jgi:hypothetical protein
VNVTLGMNPLKIRASRSCAFQAIEWDGYDDANREMTMVMSLFSENSQACYTDRNWVIRIISGSA